MYICSHSIPTMRWGLETRISLEHSGQLAWYKQWWTSQDTVYNRVGGQDWYLRLSSDVYTLAVALVYVCMYTHTHIMCTKEKTKNKQAFKRKNNLEFCAFQNNCWLQKTIHRKVWLLQIRNLLILLIGNGSSVLHWLLFTARKGMSHHGEDFKQLTGWFTHITN